MVSIRESVHQLIVERIKALQLSDQFDIGETTIRHRTTGSEFIHAGLRQNVAKVRSLEGVDICWCEEAATILNRSWEVLIPTIRKDHSEIWVSFNPELETDATYQRFVMSPPKDCITRHVSYKDNPWFPEVLRKEMEDLRAKDPDAYQHIYGGVCRYTLDGAIYARELREANEEGRICEVKYDPSKSVNLYIDLGYADNTSIWFIQHVAQEIRCIDYLEDAQRPFSHYLQQLQRRKYVYGTMWLPHDAQAKSLGTGRSIEEMARSAGWRVRIVPRLSVADGINATRTLFPSMWFDRTNCIDGIQSLRHYRYEVDPMTAQLGRNPLHDQASHGADALRYCAVAMQEKARANYRGPIAPPKLYSHRKRAGIGWLRT